jgi:hypothetical protein
MLQLYCDALQSLSHCARMLSADNATILACVGVVTFAALLLPTLLFAAASSLFSLASHCYPFFCTYLRSFPC